MSYNETLISDQFDGGLQAERDLRDHFAGLAMQAEMSRDEGWSFNTEKSLEEGCRFAYKVADAMLKARKEVKP